MKIAHNVKLSVFAHEEDDEKQVEQAFLSLMPFDLEQEKLKLSRTAATGFKERKITILEIILTKEKHTSKLLTFLKQGLSDDQRQLLLNQADSRLDNELNFFIRLDKPKLLNNEFWITDEGNCFHIRISVAAYPKKREAALGVIESWLKQ
ncbi:hypothetical protein KY349_06025 [Candidatus Woesearchaeota archaeon]|nr:hypothetical protein [Candidatus Woesearchaeota archaeon]